MRQGFLLIFFSSSQFMDAAHPHLWHGNANNGHARDQSLMILILIIQQNWSVPSAAASVSAISIWMKNNFIAHTGPRAIAL
jgi:hypothetical protein